MGIFKIFKWLDSFLLKNIDLIVEDEVIPYIKSIRSLPSNIQHDVRTAATQESIESFLNNLKDSWQKHNELAIRIDDYLASFYKGDFTLSNTEVLESTQRLICEAFSAEKKKRVYSAGVKIALEHHLPQLKNRYCLSKEDVNLLLTSWRPDFWTFRYGEHCLYRLAQIENGLDLDTEQELADMFHAGEKVLLKSRLPIICGKFQDKKSLRRKVAVYRQNIRNIKEIEIHGGYLVLGRNDLKSVQELVQYDNRNEYLFGYNLFGIPDLFLRKEITKFLVKMGYLRALPSVLQYSEKQIISALKQAGEGYRKNGKN